MAITTQSTKGQILDAASQLISVRGYHCTSLDDVLLERTIEPSLGDQSLTPIEQIHRFFDRILESQRQRNCVGGCPMGNLASELSDVHEGFRQQLAEVFTFWRASVGRVLRQAQAQGELAERADPERMAHFIVAAIQGAILMTKVTKEIEVMEQCVAELKAHLARQE